MSRFRSDRRDRTVVVKGVLSFGMGCLLACGSLAVTRTAAASAHAIKPAAAAAAPDPEALLFDIYRELSADNLHKALASADRLVAAYPTFHLGQLIRGDLLMMQTHPVTTFGDVNGPKDRLNDLREEAMVRLHSLQHRPDPRLLPRAILRLRNDQKHVLLVDARHSRLYLYENRNGQPKYVADYYISQGKLGVNKLKAGDQKTPLGVYYITAHLPGARLPDIYGSGALPINYPNEWDRLNGRSGYGIWLHGTPASSYSRPPLSSDGCVVLTNPDLYRITNSVEIGKTPVVISDDAQFVSKAHWTRDRELAARLLENWRRDVESRDQLRLMGDYSPHFRSEGSENLSAWLTAHDQFMRNARKLSVKLHDVTSFFYPGAADMIVSTFTEEVSAGRSRSTLRKRQYWVKDGSQWKIIYELNL